jgi:hypothetical protein
LDGQQEVGQGNHFYVAGLYLVHLALLLGLYSKRKGGFWLDAHNCDYTTFIKVKVEAASCLLHNEDKVQNDGCFREENKVG